MCVFVSENGMKDQHVAWAMRVCKNTVSAFSCSWGKKEGIIEGATELNLPQHKLKTACDTRWRINTNDDCKGSINQDFDFRSYRPALLRMQN